MKLRILLHLILFLTPEMLVAQPELTVSWDYRGQTFDEFVGTAERTYNIRFFFREEWTKGAVLNDYGDSPAITRVLDAVLTRLDIYYFVNKYGDIILTKDYALKRIGSTTGADSNYIPSEIMNNVPASRELSENQLVNIGNPFNRERPGNVTVSGYVTAENTC